MRKLLSLLILPLLISTTGVESQAWVAVPNYGDTGWQTFVYPTGPEGFTGTAGFVVSNVIDDSAYSELLLANLSQGGGPSNCDFKFGNFSGYTVWGENCAEIADYLVANSGQVYTPPQGQYFAHMCCLDTGGNTAAFQNAMRQPGTVGCILETAVSLPPGGSFSFDWAFLAGDHSPWNDFALFYLKDDCGQVVFSQVLAQIWAPPLWLAPALLLLLD